MQFRTPIHIVPLEQKIEPHQNGLWLGSCFAENIGRRMMEAKFSVHINPFGIQFNPLSIASTLQLLSTGHTFSDQELIDQGEQWVSLRHHGSFSGTDRVEVLAGINRAAELGKKALEEAEYLILTLGSAWVYEYKATGEVVSNCHKLPAEAFRRRRASVQEVVSTLEDALGPHLAHKEIILSVSPIRHLGEGAVENQLSKSTLIVACGILAERYRSVGYFPAYEVMMDDLRDYRFYQPDMIHPSEVAIDYIWEQFCTAALGVDAQKLVKEVALLRQAMGHRPLHAMGVEHRRFMQKFHLKAKDLHARYPLLDWRDELNYFGQ